MKTLYELEQESTDGFRNEDSTKVLHLSGQIKTLDELEQENPADFRNPESD